MSYSLVFSLEMMPKDITYNPNPNYNNTIQFLHNCLQDYFLVINTITRG